MAMIGKHTLSVLACMLLCMLPATAQTQHLTNRQINENILFAPEHEAYRYGRKTDENGVGKAWFHRFGILHISDVHQRNENLQEALEVAAGRVHAVLNTGDDANGVHATDAETVKRELSASTGTVAAYGSLPYLQVPGNHDVTGLTKKEYFDLVCTTVGRFSPSVVWGDREEYRTYGYIDFTDGPYEGDFRIIMLDPFDYDDGLFGGTYKFISAVFSQKQTDWLIDVLLDAASKGLNVITMMHYSFGDSTVFNEETANPDATFCQDPFMIPDIIDAIQKKTCLRREYDDIKGISNVRIDRDFTDAPDLEFVAHLFGHIHSRNHYRCQRADGKKYDILMLGESALGIPGTALNKKHMERGTITGIAFSALEIDVVEKAVYRVAYGAYRNHDKTDSPRTMKIPYRFD